MDYKSARGWLTANERQTLVDLAKGKQTIVNIGVEYGASLHCLYQGSPSALIVGVDIDISKAEVDDLPIALIEADSHEYVKVWDRGIDLLFIDGDHSYEGAKADLVWIDWIYIGGTVVFHDCYDWPPSPPMTPHRMEGVEVNRAAQEWVEGYEGMPTVATSVWHEQLFVDTMRIFTRME